MNITILCQILLICLSKLCLAANPIIVISIDGLRPDAISKESAKTIYSLRESGLNFNHATTIRPSITLPAHTSMITGIDPKKHGIIWDYYRPDYGPVKFVTALELAHNAHFHVAAFVAKEKLLHLYRPNSVDRFTLTEQKGKAISEAFAEYVHQNGLPDVSFLHLPDPDNHGHLSLWMSPSYFDGVEKADEAVNSILATAQKASNKIPTIIISADHGGFGFGHLLDIDENNHIPLIVNGENIPQGLVKQDGVKVYDIAPTILSLLDIPVPDDWDSKALPLYHNLKDTALLLSLGKTPHICQSYLRLP